MSEIKLPPPEDSGGPSPATAAPAWPIRLGSLSPGISTMLLLIELAPSLIRRTQFETIEGGLAFPAIGVDILIAGADEERAVAPGDISRHARCAGRCTIALHNTRAGLRAHAAASDGTLAVKSGIIWADPFDPQFRVVSAYPVAGLKWHLVDCLTVDPTAGAMVLQPPDLPKLSIDHGFSHAKEVVSRWQRKLKEGL